MKKLLVLFVTAMVFQLSFAQTNTFPSNGSVGIGTTSPSTLLHVTGNYNGGSDNLIPQMLFENANTSTSGSVFSILRVRTGNGYQAGYPELWMEASTTNGVGITKIRTVSATPLAFFSSDAERMRIDASGNVGIGTTNPSYRFVVTGISNLQSSSWGIPSLGSIGNETSMFLTNNDPKYGILGGVHGSGYGWLQVQRVDGSTSAYALNLQPNGGNVGIGTTIPAGALDVVKGSTRIQMASNSTGLGDIFRIFGLNGSAFAVNSYVPSSNKLITDLGINYAIDGGNGAIPYALIGTKKAPVFRLNAEDGSIALYGDNGTGSDYRTPAFNLGLFVQGDGKVGIGTNNTQGYQLAVNGDAIFTKVKVKTYATWPDYVFHRNYKLRPLKDLENYIKLNDHLPDVPSASDVEKNGLDLGDNQAVLLKKIEELTLYIIDQDKKITELKDTNKKLEEQSKAIESLTKQVETLKSLLSNK